MREIAYPFSLNVLPTTAAILLCASMAYADPPSAAAPAPAAKNANTAPLAAVAPAPGPQFPATGMTRSVRTTRLAVRAAATTLPSMTPTTSIQPATTRIAPAAWSAAATTEPIHPTAIATRPVSSMWRGLRLQAAYGPAASAPRNSYELAGQNGQTQTTYYRPNAAPATAAAQPATATECNTAGGERHAMKTWTMKRLLIDG